MNIERTIEEMIALEDKLYFDRKACESAFIKGFVLGSTTVLVGFILIAAAGVTYFNWCMSAFGSH